MASTWNEVASAPPISIVPPDRLPANVPVAALSEPANVPVAAFNEPANVALPELFRLNWLE